MGMKGITDPLEAQLRTRAPQEAGREHRLGPAVGSHPGAATLAE